MSEQARDDPHPPISLTLNLGELGVETIDLTALTFDQVEGCRALRAPVRACRVIVRVIRCANLIKALTTLLGRQEREP